MCRKQIILASASPRRKELLRLTGLKFKVVPSDYEESLESGMRPRALAVFLSRKKAEEVARRYEDTIVIAADTFIVFRGRLLGKPHTEYEARRMLNDLNGKTHSVITGFTIIDTSDKKRLSRSVETKVRFRKLTQQEIESYVRSKEPLDKAGAYAIQGLGSLLVRRIEGDYFNVIGLPLGELVEGLKKFGIRVL